MNAISEQFVVLSLVSAKVQHMGDSARIAPYEPITAAQLWVGSRVARTFFAHTFSFRTHSEFKVSETGAPPMFR